MRIGIGGGLMLVRRKQFEEIAATNEQRCDYDIIKALLEQTQRELRNATVRCTILEDLNDRQARTIKGNHETYTAGLKAGKWHSAGGYGKKNHALRRELAQAQQDLQDTGALLAETASQRFTMQHLLEKWQPIVEALETTPGQFTGQEVGQ